MQLPVWKFIGIIQLWLRRQGMNQEFSLGSVHNLSKQFHKKLFIQKIII